MRGSVWVQGFLHTWMGRAGLDRIPWGWLWSVPGAVRSVCTERIEGGMGWMGQGRRRIRAGTPWGLLQGAYGELGVRFKVIESRITVGRFTIRIQRSRFREANISSRIQELTAGG